MINKYRKKFIFISMLSLFIVLALVIGLINILNYAKVVADCDFTIERLINKEGPFIERKEPEDISDLLPPPMDGEMQFDFNKELRFQVRYFIVTLNADGSFKEADLTHIASIDEELASSYAKKVTAKNKTKGFFQDFRYLKYEEEGNSKIIFLESHKELASANYFFVFSFISSAAGFILVFILIWLLSKIVVKPFVKNQEKQKMFITDASHELKTPLTIISADIDVLELENGQSEWTNSIRKQVERLRKLTSQLTMLSKMDEELGEIQLSEFNLSDALFEAVDDYKNLFLNDELPLDVNIEKDIIFKGNQELFNELFVVMFDNANKYAEGEIKITLTKENKTIKLEFMNKATVPNGNLDYLFNRFTRLDSDRNSQSGGSGIGLAIAKEIVDLHQGTIKAEGLNDFIKFTILLKA